MRRQVSSVRIVAHLFLVLSTSVVAPAQPMKNCQVALSPCLSDPASGAAQLALAPSGAAQPTELTVGGNTGIGGAGHGAAEHAFSGCSRNAPKMSPAWPECYGPGVEFSKPQGCGRPRELCVSRSGVLYYETYCCCKCRFGKGHKEDPALNHTDACNARNGVEVSMSASAAVRVKTLKKAAAKEAAAPEAAAQVDADNAPVAAETVPIAGVTPAPASDIATAAAAAETAPAPGQATPAGGDTMPGPTVPTYEQQAAWAAPWWDLAAAPAAGGFYYAGSFYYYQ